MCYDLSFSVNRDVSALHYITVEHSLRIVFAIIVFISENIT